MAKKTYTHEFNLKVIRAVEKGELRPAQARHEYQIAERVSTAGVTKSGCVERPPSHR